MTRKVVVDYVRDLPSAKKPILFLGFLFLQTDLLLEVWILVDLFQSRNNSRVQHFKLRKISTWIDRDDSKSSPLNRPSRLLWSITKPPTEREKNNLPGFLILFFQHENVEGAGIYRTEAPTFAVFAVQPRILWNTMRVPNAWRPIFAARHSTRNWRKWERHRLTGNVGMSTAYWFSILKISWIIHTINFIL